MATRKKKFSSEYQEKQEFAGELCKEIAACIAGNQLKTARARLDILILTFDELEQQKRTTRKKKTQH